MFRNVFLFLALAATASAQLSLQQHLGPGVQSSLGRTVRNAGDADGDGFDDIVAGGPGGQVGVLGRVFVYSGATGAQLRLWTGGMSFGLGVDGCGDVNGDGRSDVLVGQTGTGAEIRNVLTGFAIRSISAPPASGIFGEHVAGIGDVTMDGVPDAAVSTYNIATIVIASGATGSIVQTLQPDGQNHSLIPASCGDVNGDGVPEILVGNPFHAVSFGGNTVSDVGRARLYSGATYAILREWLPTPMNGNSMFGGALADVGDLDGDSVPDVAIGAETLATPSGTNDGAVFVFSGLGGGLIRTLFPPPGVEKFGRAVTGAGDLNGDGIPEIAVGATTPGSVHVFSGADGTELLRLDGQASALYGRSLDSVADLNGDGLREILVGSPDFTLNFEDQGLVQVISGLIYAAVTPLPAGCTAGPFQPQLGSTLPILGQSFTLVGVNAPAGAATVLGIGPAIPFAFSLGYPGCDVWIDPATAALLALGPVPASGTWNATIALPLVPSLAGLAFNVQSFYGPTATPIGIDVSNGLRLRLGH